MMRIDETYPILPPLDLPRIAQTLEYTCGAACFESMFKYFKGYSPGEMYFAEKLESICLGYTPLINIINLARSYGFFCEMLEGGNFTDLLKSFFKHEVIFVTWWYEDAGHYSLIKHIDSKYITLMDPWVARIGCDHKMAIIDFIPHWQSRGSKMISVSQ